MSSAQTSADLTRNQSLVFSTLQSSSHPLSAYSLLDALRDEGFRAPLQVYRALDKLIELGLVHRLESLNAFIACNHPDCESHPSMAFAICDACGEVAEMNCTALTEQLWNLSQTQSFTLKKATIELRGLCQNCTAKA